MKKQRPAGLPSTVVIGILLLISLLFLVPLLSLNVHDAINGLGSSTPIPEDAGEMGMVYLLAAGIGVVAILLAAAILALATALTAAIPLCFAIRNLRAEHRGIRGVNVGYVAALSAILLLLLSKLLLILLGIG